MTKADLRYVDLDAERALLAVLLLDGNLRTDLVSIANPDHLWRAQHSEILKAIYSVKATPDVETVRAYLAANGKLDRVGGLAYLAELVGIGVTVANASAYARTVRDLADKRAIEAALVKATGTLAKTGSKAATEQVRRELERIEAAQPVTGAEVALLTADDILTGDWPDPVWIVPLLLPADLAILAGKAKLGKSWLTLQLAQAVAAGGKALGHQVEAGPVLYLALEDSAQSLRDRMAQQRWPAGLPVDFITLTEFARKIGDLRKGGGDKLAGIMAARRYRLVVIDTLSRAVSGDQNDVAEMTAALSPLQEMAQQHTCGVLLVDHHNKLAGGDALADILGSTAKGAVADTLLGLYRKRGKADAKLAVVGRRVLDQNLALTFDGVTGCWQSHGDADELEITENRQAIIDTLTDLGRSKLADLVEALDRNKGSVYRDLQDLTHAGLVTKSGSTYGVAQR